MAGTYHLSDFIIPRWPDHTQWVEIGQFATLDAACTAAKIATILNRVLVITQDGLVIMAYHDDQDFLFVDNL